jgi:hypothetical protein
MILVYAYGSGLGHLKRVYDFLLHQHIQLQNCIILTQSEYGDFWNKEFVLKILPKERFRDKSLFLYEFRHLIDIYNVKEILVDVFPEGFYGELTACLADLTIKKTLLARIISPRYFKEHPIHTVYDQIYVTERGVEAGPYRFRHFKQIEIEYHFEQPMCLDMCSEPYHLILHSQPAEEVMCLYKLSKMYDNQVKTIIFSMCDHSLHVTDANTIMYTQKHPCISDIANATKIFAGIGFNTVRMLKNYITKTIFVPFPRIYDDQFLRKGFL